MLFRTTNMKFKIIVSTLIVLLAITQSSTKSIETTKDNDDVLKSISKILLKLNGVIGTLLNDVSKRIEEASNKVYDIQNGLTKKVNNIGDKILSIIVKEIENISNKTDDLGKQVIKCIDQETLKFHSLLSNTVSDIVACSTAQLGDLFTDIKLLVDDVSQAHDQLRVLETDLGNCTANIEECSAEFLTNATAVGEKLLETLKVDGESAMEIIQQIGVTVDACVDENLEVMGDKNAEYFNEVLQCVSNA